jgi:hypothetical protein
VFTRPAIMAIATFFFCSACAQRGGDDWANIDYSKVYKAAGQRRDIDSDYKSPSVVGCVDDDLFNCK